MDGSSPGVCLRTPANSLGAAVAAKVAAGAAEALGLAFGPERRLMTITAEATKNVIDHAYLDRPIGEIELIIELQGASPDSGIPPSSGEVLVSVRDTGCGYPLSPTAADPPGLGLSMIYELSDELTIRSLKDAGTEIGAAVRFGKGRTAETTSPPPEGGVTRGRRSELAFGDPVFLTTILPGAVAAHAVALHGSIDEVAEALHRGELIARRLAGSVEPPAVDIRERPDSRCLEVRIGPMEPVGAQALLQFLREDLTDREASSLNPPSDPSVEGSGCVTVEIPLH